MADDYPLAELARGMAQLLANAKKDGDIMTAYFKWTCDACGERVTADQPNVVLKTAEHTGCPVTPGYQTDTRVKGGNYLVLKQNVGHLPQDGQHRRRNR